MKRIHGRREGTVHTLFEELRAVIDGDVIVLGVGNTMRADDGAGCLVAARLAETYPERAFDVGQTPENYVGPIRRAEAGTLIVVDAADFDGAPGEIRLVTPDDIGGLMIGTHAAPLGLFMRALSEDTRCRAELVAIQAANTTLDGELTAEVALAIGAVTDVLLQILGLRGG
ncbi:hydrogenase maturation protease [bacterium]|nr:hydrogenase maturation protease [bacterium]